MVSIYDGVNDTKGVIVSLDSVIQRITSGAKGLDRRTREANALYQTEPEKYKPFKEKFPAATFSGTFKSRLAKNLIEHSGKIILDIDGVEPGSVLAELNERNDFALAFISPSALGTKVLCEVTPIPTNPIEHKVAFVACCEQFSNLDCLIDPSGSDVSRLCFLAHDPQAIINENPTPIEWDYEAYLEEQQERELERERRITEYDKLPSDATVLDYIDPDIDTLPEKSNYDTWVAIGMAAKAAGLPFDVWDHWSQRGAKYNAEEMRSKWQSFAEEVPKGGVSWGSVVFLARENGYRPRRTRKTIRLHQKSDFQCTLEPTEKSREQIAEVFDSGKNFVGLRADTCVGKTEQAIFYYLKGYGGFFSTPTTELAKEIYDRFYKTEIDVFRWRGVASEPDGEFPHQKPCMYPEQYIELAKRGRNAYKSLCESCPYITECEADGYRSQEEKAKNAQVVVAPHKDLLMDPTFRRTAVRLLPGHTDDQITIDEFDILEAFLKIEISQARLEYLRDTWHDHALGTFAKLILNACVVQNAAFTGISHNLTILSERERQEIITGLASLRIGDTIMNSDEAHDYEQRSHQSLDVESIRQRPIIEDDPDWNLLTKLEMFFDVFEHADTAPLTWENNTLTFYLPPLPVYTKARVVLMSATLNETFFRQVFSARQQKRDDIDFIDAHDTEWHPEAKVFQLRTNRNPRRTLLTGEKDAKGKWRYTRELSETGKQYLERIRESIANSKVNCGFIGHKAVIENHTDGLDAPTGHFGGLVGLNQHFYRDEDDGITLHILGSPNVGQEAVETAAKLLYGMTASPLDFTRNDDGTYDDPNVQTVADAIVKSELTQAVGRAGLVKNPSTVVIWTSQELPSISHRNQTTLFDETDWENAQGNLDALPAVIAEREKQEAAEQKAIESGNVQTVMETKAVSEQHAHKLTKHIRADQKAQRDAQVIALYDNGKGLNTSEIHRETGIPRSTINRILKPIKQGDQNTHRHVTVPHVDAGNGHPPENRDVPVVSTDTPVKNLFDWDIKTRYLRREEIANDTSVSSLLKALSEEHPLRCFSDDERLKVEMEHNEITSLAIVNKNYIFEFGGEP